MGFYITDETQDRGPRAAAHPWDPKPSRGPIREVISGYRFYNPDLGRWINRDPIGELGGVHLYAFLKNHVIAAIDLFGAKIYLPGDPGYPNLPPGPGEDSCDQDIAGASGWSNREYSGVMTCSKDHELTEFDYEMIPVVLPIIDIWNPISWTMPPGVEIWLAEGKIEWLIIEFRKISESYIECNCREGNWQWRETENADGYSKKFMYEKIDESEASMDKATQFLVANLGGLGAYPDENEVADRIKADWKADAKRMESLSSKCPAFGKWEYE